MCNHGTEFVRRLHIGWPELLQLVIYNYAKSDRLKRTYHYPNGCRFDNLFDLDEILKYLKELWNSLHLPPEVITQKFEYQEMGRGFKYRFCNFRVIFCRRLWIPLNEKFVKCSKIKNYRKFGLPCEGGCRQQRRDLCMIRCFLP